MAYRRSIPRGTVAGLLAGALTAIWEAKSASSGVSGTFSGAFAVSLPIMLALGGFIGLSGGIVEGAFAARFGSGYLGRAWRRLNDRSTEGEELDRKSAVAVIAGGVGLLTVALVTAIAARGLMDVARKSVGAFVIGLLAAAIAVPIAFAVATVAYDLLLKVRRFVPRIGPLPRSAVVLLIPVLLLLAVAAKIWLGLDTRNLKIGHLILLIVLLALTVLIAVALTRSAKLVATLEKPVFVPASILLVLACLGAVSLAARTTNRNADVRRAVMDHTQLVRTVVTAVQARADRDHDGYPARVVFGSSVDCDDSNRDVHPGAAEVPDNGLDDNCKDGDGHAQAKPNVTTAGSPPPAATKAGALRWDGNVLLIGIDTLRADRVGAVGETAGGKSLTPTIDALAARGVVFTQARAQAPNTPRSFPSLFTSRMPSRVKFDDPIANYGVVLPENELLFEVTSKSGLKSFGETSHFYFTEERGITQGAEWDNTGAKSIKDSNPDIAGPRTIEKTAVRLRKLAQEKSRFVGFVHLFEPHSTYVTHPEYPITKSGVPGLIEKYDMEIRYCDDQIAALLKVLAETGLDKNTAIVLFSDHGEAFGDHTFAGQRMFFHGQTVFDELMRVPLVISFPEGKRAEIGVTASKIGEPVMLVDVAPTVLDLLKIPAPASFEGQSLLPALFGEPLLKRASVSELLPAKSWMHDAKAWVSADGKLKLIWRPSEDLMQLFDLKEDAKELKDISKSRSEDLSRLKADLDRWLESGTL